MLKLNASELLKLSEFDLLSEKFSDSVSVEEKLLFCEFEILIPSERLLFVAFDKDLAIDELIPTETEFCLVSVDDSL